MGFHLEKNIVKNFFLTYYHFHHLVSIPWVSCTKSVLNNTSLEISHCHIQVYCCFSKLLQASDKTPAARCSLWKVQQSLSLSRELKWP